MIETIVDANGKHGLAARATWPRRAPASSAAGAAYIVTDILAGNTDKKINPYWGKWAIYDGKTRRPAAYKTGTTSDNRDVAAYGYLAPPTGRPDAPALAVGVWMGNSDNSPNDGKLSLDTSAPLWSAILTEISQGLPIADFVQPDGLETAEVDAFTGLKPGPFTTKTVEEIFLPGTVPTQEETSRVALDIDSASGLLWQDGCAGPKVTQGFFDLAEVEADHAELAAGERRLGRQGGEGLRAFAAGRRTRGPRTSTTTRSPRSGGRWGAPFAPTELCPIVEVTCDPFAPSRSVRLVRSDNPFARAVPDRGPTSASSCRTCNASRSSGPPTL